MCSCVHRARSVIDGKKIFTGHLVVYEDHAKNENIVNFVKVEIAKIFTQGMNLSF